MLIISKYYRFSIKIKLNKCMYNTTNAWQPYGCQAFVVLYAAVRAKQGLLFPLQLSVCSFGETCSSCLVQAAHRGVVWSALHNVGV